MQDLRTNAQPFQAPPAGDASLFCIVIGTAVQAPCTRAQLYPLVDYILPVFPSVNCFSPQRTDSSTATPSAAFSSYLTQVTNKIKQFSLTGLVFTMQYGPRHAAIRSLCAELAHCPRACIC